MGWQFWSSIKETGFLSIKLLSHFGVFKSGRSWAFGVVWGVKVRRKGFLGLKSAVRVFHNPRTTQVRQTKIPRFTDIRHLRPIRRLDRPCACLPLLPTQL